MKTSRTHLFLVLALAGFVLSVAPARGGDEPAAGSGWDGYVRLMPRFYDFVDDQSYLQRYRFLDSPNEDGVDQTFAVINEFALELGSESGGAPRLEVFHTNPFVLNDHWLTRWRPADGSRFELQWDDYERPLDAFLPHPAADTITYASRYNDDRAPEEELFRRRRDLSVRGIFDPAAWSGGLSFAREFEVEAGRSTRAGNRQFSWIFGVVEDLVVPAGNNPERWRGRTEEIDQTIDRFSVAATLRLGGGNRTWLKVFGESFENHEPTLTNADVAVHVPAINSQRRTINYIPDHDLSGAEFRIEQSLGTGVVLVADGFTGKLEQKGRAPLEAEAEYRGVVRTEGASLGVAWDASDRVAVDASGGYSKRTNETPVGTSADETRAYLLQDRNLSTPFLGELTVRNFAGSVTLAADHVTARFGASHQDSEREFVRGTGSNSIPEALTVWRPDSNPTTLWASLSGRAARRLRWNARYEYLSAEETWSVADPEERHRARGSVSFSSPSGMAGASATVTWETSHNDQFTLAGSLGAAPQRMDVDAANAGFSGFWAPAPAIQLFAGYQWISRDQAGNLVLTDVRRWRPWVEARVADGDFGYESTVHVWNAGAALSFGEKLVVVPSVTFADSEGGIESRVAPVGEFTWIGNEALTFAVSSDYRLSPRSQVNFRYAFSDYDDEADPVLSGSLHEVSLGVTFAF